MNLIKAPHDLDVAAMSVRAVVETPRGGRNKFTYEPALKAFELSHLLPEGFAFPLDFGFIPSTKAQDGDPLDVMVLADEPLTTGAVLEVRLLGVIEAEQIEDGQSLRNDRLIARSVKSLLFAKVERIEDLGEAFLENLTRFWKTYNQARGRTFKVIAIRSPAEAADLIRRQTI
jgi:inorganic pyrophosphatase